MFLIEKEQQRDVKLDPVLKEFAQNSGLFHVLKARGLVQGKECTKTQMMSKTKTEKAIYNEFQGYKGKKINETIELEKNYKMIDEIDNNNNVLDHNKQLHQQDNDDNNNALVYKEEYDPNQMNDQEYNQNNTEIQDEKICTENIDETQNQMNDDEFGKRQKQMQKGDKTEKYEAVKIKEQCIDEDAIFSEIMDQRAKASGYNFSDIPKSYAEQLWSVEKQKEEMVNNMSDNIVVKTEKLNESNTMWKTNKDTIADSYLLVNELSWHDAELQPDLTKIQDIPYDSDCFMGFTHQKEQRELQSGKLNPIDLAINEGKNIYDSQTQNKFCWPLNLPPKPICDLL